MTGWIWWMLAGLASFVGGIVALANPLAATLTAELMVGYLFIAVGVLMLLSILSDGSWGSRLMSLLLGVVVLAVGISLVAHPMGGVVSLTVLVAALMLIIGGVRIVLGFAAPSGGMRAVLIVAGLISLGLGIMIFANFPWSATVVLGVLLAVELISNGISLLVVAFAVRAQRDAEVS